MFELDHLLDQQRFARLLGVALTDNRPSDPAYPYAAAHSPAKTTA